MVDTSIQLMTYVHWGIFALAHLVGLGVAIALLVRVKGTPAILATVAFGVLFLQDIGTLLRTIFLNRLIFGQLSVESGPWAVNGLNCCCGLLHLIAVFCLLVAVWQAASEGGGSEEAL